LGVLKTNNSFNFSKNGFDAEKLIHKSEFKLIINLAQLLRVAKTFKQDELLVGSLGGNGLFQELHDTLEIEVDS
jgi:hypothetical protein